MPPPTDADFDYEDVAVILTEAEAPTQRWPLVLPRLQHLSDFLDLTAVMETRGAPPSPS